MEDDSAVSGDAEARGMITNTPEAWSERAKLSSSWGAALWSDRGQRARFESVLDALDLEPGDLLLDYGCGTGAFSELLPEDVNYVGYDWSHGMLKRARKEHPERRFVGVLRGDPYDHIICVGPFNLPDGWSKDQTFTTLSWLWKWCRRTMVVCLYAGEDPHCLVYSEEETHEFATSLGGRYSVARHLPNDLLLVIEKE